MNVVTNACMHPVRDSLCEGWVNAALSYAADAPRHLDECGNTALHIAVDWAVGRVVPCEEEGRRRVAVVRQLLETHPWMRTARNYNLDTPLHIATRASNVPIIEAILGSGAEDAEDAQVLIGGANLNGSSPLHIAAAVEDERVFETLYAHAAHASGQSLQTLFGGVDARGDTIAHIAASSGNQAALRRVIEHAKHLSGVRNSAGLVPMHVAIIQYTGDAHADSEASSAKWAAALELLWDGTHDLARDLRIHVMHEACRRGHVRIVRCNMATDECFAKTACDCVALQPDGDGKYPIHHASENGHANIVKDLIERWVHLNCTADDEGNTPLHLAVAGRSGGVVETMRVLLNVNRHSGDPVMMRNFYGSTPTMRAAQGGCVDALDELLGIAPATAAMTDNDGLMPIHHAIFGDHADVVRALLRTNPAMVRAPSVFGPPFAMAIRSAQPGTVEALLDRDPTLAKDLVDGMTALQALLVTQIDIQRPLHEDRVLPIVRSILRRAPELASVATHVMTATPCELAMLAGCERCADLLFGDAPRDGPTCLTLLKVALEKHMVGIAKRLVPGLHPIRAMVVVHAYASCEGGVRVLAEDVATAIIVAHVPMPSIAWALVPKGLSKGAHVMFDVVSRGKTTDIRGLVACLHPSDRAHLEKALELLRAREPRLPNQLAWDIVARAMSMSAR